MIAWVGLLKKDFKLTKTVFFAGLAINFLMLMLALYVGSKAEDKLFIFIPLLVAVALHVIYFPIMLFISLKTESNQLHLWLHNPQPASTLLLSKIMNGLMMLVISLISLYVMAGLLSIPKFSLFKAYWTDTWTAGLLIFFHIIVVSIYFGIGVILLWSLYQFFKYRIGRLRWLVIIGVVIIPCLILELFQSTALYVLLTGWGSINYTFPTFPVDPIQAYAGEYLYNLLLIIGLFYLSTWIIDKKVEV